MGQVVENLPSKHKALSSKLQYQRDRMRERMLKREIQTIRR
jgi:hypothetical protein